MIATFRWVHPACQVAVAACQSAGVDYQAHEAGRLAESDADLCLAHDDQDEAEARAAGMRCVRLLSSPEATAACIWALQPGSRPETTGADLRGEVTVFVTTVGDALNFPDCVGSLAAQSAQFRGPVILDHVAPMNAAFQAMLDKCVTPFYVQVDEDMALRPWAIERLHQEITRADSRVVMVCAPLWDVDTERPIQGVKIFRHTVCRRYPFRESMSCEMDQVRRWEADGYRHVGLPMAGSDACFGDHARHWTPRSLFQRWRRVTQKHRRYGWMAWIEPYRQRHLERWRRTGEPTHLAAVLGIVAGLCGELPPDREADYREADPEWERLSAAYGLG